jgi:ATP-dependent RNA helicase RhlE
MNSFAELALIAPLQKAVLNAGYLTPTPIQAQSIPHLLRGRDLLGCARTGTGKTAAFALPILQRLAEHPQRGARPVRALVLVPTRELAAQVSESFRRYGADLPLTTTVIYGGVGQGPQVNALRRGVDIVVATPGRLVDLMGQGHLRLDRVEVLVLDEADHMLDLGFIPDVRKVLAVVPRKRQTLFFSATMPPPIAKLASTILSDPAEVTVTPVASSVELIEQSVHFVDKAGKPRLLAQILSDKAVESALVFTRTKRGADRVAKRLGQDGIPAEAIHGNKSQNNRERTLEGFRAGRIRVLVATDIAARGIDVDGITHVVNFELPNVPESYVHRIGRTGRAGASGIAISLCDAEERPLLRDIEKLIRRELPKVGTLRGGTRRDLEPEFQAAGRGRNGARSQSHARPANGRHSTERSPVRAPGRVNAREEVSSRFAEGLDEPVSQSPQRSIAAARGPAGANVQRASTQNGARSSGNSSQGNASKPRPQRKPHGGSNSASANRGRSRRTSFGR